jgi:hypothetical protein
MANWKVGDLAVCVNAKFSRVASVDLLVLRAVYRVSGVIYDDREGVGLVLAGINPAPYVALRAERFRKITSASNKFTAQIRACRPAHRKTPVSA